jgi:hypothetical protein
MLPTVLIYEQAQTPVATNEADSLDLLALEKKAKKLQKFIDQFENEAASAEVSDTKTPKPTPGVVP